jgi:hypothetical protein
LEAGEGRTKAGREGFASCLEHRVLDLGEHGVENRGHPAQHEVGVESREGGGVGMHFSLSLLSLSPLSLSKVLLLLVPFVEGANPAFFQNGRNHLEQEWS